MRAATQQCLLFCQNLGGRTSSKNIPKSFAYLADATNTKIWHISGSTLSTHLVTVSLFWVIISQSDFPYFPQFRQTLYGFIIWRYHLKLWIFIQIIFQCRISWKSAQFYQNKSVSRTTKINSSSPHLGIQIASLLANTFLIPVQILVQNGPKWSKMVQNGPK